MPAGSKVVPGDGQGKGKEGGRSKGKGKGKDADCGAKGDGKGKGKGQSAGLSSARILCGNYMQYGGNCKLGNWIPKECKFCQADMGHQVMLSQVPQEAGRGVGSRAVVVVVLILAPSCWLHWRPKVYPKKQLAACCKEVGLVTPVAAKANTGDTWQHHQRLQSKISVYDNDFRQTTDKFRRQAKELEET